MMAISWNEISSKCKLIQRLSRVQGIQQN